MRSYRYKVADEQLGRVFVGDTPTQPERARRAAVGVALEDAAPSPAMKRQGFSVGRGMRVGADPDAPTHAPPPMTRERQKAEGLLALLELDHNTIAREGDTHESAVELDRRDVVSALEALAMTATGALHASIPRPDLVGSAAKDAAKMQAASIDAYTRAVGPLGKSVAGEMMRASSTASELAIALASLPGSSPPAVPTPAAVATGPHARPGGAAGELAELEDDAGPPPRPRAARAGVAAVGLLGLVALLAARGHR